MDSLEAEPRVFLDPNQLSEDGTISLRGTAFSENGQYFAYSLSKSGSDWVTIKVKKAPTGEEMSDVLERVKFSSIAWTHDHKGFFYNITDAKNNSDITKCRTKVGSQYPEQDGKSDGTETTSNLNQKLFYHWLGKDQSEDVLVAEFPDNPKWMIGCEVSDCGRYLVMAICEGCDPVNRLYYVDLSALPNGIDGKLPYVKVVDNFDAEYEYITNEGSLMTFKTNLKSPHYKLINIDFSKPEMENWKDLVPENEKDVLEWAACVNNNKLILCYLQDVKNMLYVHDLATGQRLANFPIDVGSIAGYSGKKKHSEIFYQFVSFLTPGIIYRCDVSTDTYKSSIFRETVVKGFQFDQFDTKQVFYPSKDGTKIPMFIVHSKNVTLDGNNPVMLYGYGGFNIPLTPSFSVSRLVFLQHLGGVYALANIRGGGEYGETWHKGGMLANKQNVFDDFQCAAEYLIQNKYTSAKKLCINGGSNGGLLVGACINQRPELYGCAFAQVGVMDMLRFHKFTIGHAWTTDYGCSDKPDQFDYIIKYSPLHNVTIPSGDKQYPSVLLLTADHDDRVVPLHSLKYIAELQHVVGPSEKQTNPLMIRIDTKAGHGAGKPTTKIGLIGALHSARNTERREVMETDERKPSTIEELTDIYCFMYQTVGLEWRDNGTQAKY